MDPEPMRSSGGHLVQFFGGDEERLVRNVARYLSDSLRGGGGAMVIAGSARRDAILRELGERLGDALPSDRIDLLDDAETLARFMSDGRPDAALFDASVGATARELHERFGRLRAYGEMVGTLWMQGAREAAAILEELWNELRQRVPFELYCGYPIDVLSDDFQMGTVRGVLSNHTHVVPALSPEFGTAMHRALGDVFGERGHGLWPLAAASCPSLPSIPVAERTILKLRSALPRYADDVIEKARLLARENGQSGLHMGAEPGQYLDVEMGTEPLH